MKGNLLDFLRAGNRWTRSGYRPFVVEGTRVGWVAHGFAQRLAGFPEVLSVTEAQIGFASRVRGAAARTAELEAILRPMKNAPNFGRWCDEKAAVVKLWGETPLFVIERSVMTAFGVRGFGVHVNGYVRGRGGLRLWIARRDSLRSDYGGQLDSLVGGFLPYRAGIRATLAKEAWEEAGVPAALAARAVPTGAICNCIELPQGVCPYGIFCFDLELPEDFAPENQDGEIEGFELLDMTALDRKLSAGHFKFNTIPILADFMLRHGVIEPAGPDYFELLRLTRSWGDDER